MKIRNLKEGFAHVIKQQEEEIETLKLNILHLEGLIKTDGILLTQNKMNMSTLQEVLKVTKKLIQPSLKDIIDDQTRR